MRPMTKAMVELMKEAIKTGTLAAHLEGGSGANGGTRTGSGAAAVAAAAAAMK